MKNKKTDIRTYCLTPKATIKQALAMIEHNSGKIVLVVNAKNVLVGTVTDGDVRRALLKNIPLETPIKKIMNEAPQTVNENENSASLFALMQSRNIRNLPVVNLAGQIVDIVNMADMLVPERLENLVVIMAGGLGSRLRPLTHDTPKPMLEVGGSPVLEILIKNFISQGFQRFCISVNYLAEQIKCYFGDGSEYGVEISYLEEDEPLGTAGSLSLLKHRPQHPFIVINGDIVTNIQFSDMLHFHSDANAAFTMGVREHSIQIPYGVVELNDCKISNFLEKPTEKYFVNTGIYVVSPQILNLISAREPVTMPELMVRAQDNQYSVQAFPITKAWLDIGRIEDFGRAESLIQEIKNEDKM